MLASFTAEGQPHSIGGFLKSQRVSGAGFSVKQHEYYLLERGSPLIEKGGDSIDGDFGSLGHWVAVDTGAY